MTSSANTGLSRRTLGLDPAVAIGLAAAVIFFLVSGAIAYLNLQALKEGNDRIVQTHRAIVALDQMLSIVQDAETGQRGFLLTNDPRYLEPYTAALRSVPLKLAEIGDLSGESSAQAPRIARLKQHLDAKLDEMKDTIELRRSQGLEAVLPIVNSDRGKTEMDAIRVQLAEMATEETRVRQERLAQMASAQATALASSLLSGVLGLILTLTIGFLIRRATLARRREDWLQAGQVGLATAMLGDQSLEQLGDSVLQFLASYTGAVAGAFFVGGGIYRRATAYGVPEDAKLPLEIKPREGLLGQAAAENRTLVISDAPEGYLAFGSALGQARPSHLALVPASLDGKVNSVFELGFLHPINERTLALLEEASAAIAIGVRSATYREELQTLLDETQRQAEELQTQSEELRVSNEELEEQGRALKESQGRL